VNSRQISWKTVYQELRIKYAPINQRTRRTRGQLSFGFSRLKKDKSDVELFKFGVQGRRRVDTMNKTRRFCSSIEAVKVCNEIQNDIKAF